MCMKVKCPKCGKFTWQGCGMHKDQVLKDVPLEERCECPRSGGCIILMWPACRTGHGWRTSRSKMSVSENKITFVARSNLLRVFFFPKHGHVVFRGPHHQI